MSNQDLSKIKGQMPVSVIVHGGNYISFLLAKTLLEQGSYVIIVDKYTNTSKQYFSQLKKSGKVSFIDFKGIKPFYEKVARIDYLYYMLGEKTEENQNISRIDSKDFLSETNYLNISLATANKFKAKIALITSLKLNRELSNRINNQQDGKTKPYSPLELQRYGENYAAEFVDKTKANLRIIRMGTVIGKGITQITDSTLHKLFSDATQKGQIEIDGEGLEIHNIIHESDATYGLLKLTFSDDTKGEVISLCNKNDYTTLSLAYKLLELDVESKAIKFVESTDSSSILVDLYVSAPNAQGYGWKQNISLEESIINQIQAYYQRSDKKWEIDKTRNSRSIKSQDSISNTKRTKFGDLVFSLLEPLKSLTNPAKFSEMINITKLAKFVSLSLTIFLLVYFLIGPIFGIGLGGYLVYKNGNSLNENVKNLDFESIQRDADSISNNISKVDNNLERIYWVFKIVNKTETYDTLNKLVQGTEYMSDSIQDLIESLRPFGEYIKDFQPAISTNTQDSLAISDYTEYLESTDSNIYILREGIYKMSLAESVILSVQTSSLPSYLQEYVLEYKNILENINSTVKPLEDVAQFVPDLLGVTERKRYLILLQDDKEIRSTGGWISTYAIIALQGGQIREMYVDDIYNAQATLRLKNKYYKPLASLEQALGQTTYSFPLVNWQPSLEEVLLSSEQYIYDLEKGEYLDGVITVDTSVLERLLDSWGGIEVPGESSLITSGNIYSMMYESSNASSPSDIRSTTFLTDFFDAFLKKFFSSNFNEYVQISHILSDSLNEKHLTINFKNTTANSFVKESKWNSTLDTTFSSTPTNIDWNWGANKANLYIKKNHTLDIEISGEETVEYSYQVAITNDSESNTYPQGDYINYTRIYIPYNAQLTGLRGFEQNEYDLYQEQGYQVIGGWFNVPAKETKTLDIKYRLVGKPNTANFPLLKNDTHYEMNLNIYKQPGSKNDAYTLTVNYPTDWNIETYKGLTNIENILTSRFELSSDKDLFISWQR